MRVVLTGVTITGQDVLDKLVTEGWMSLNTCIDDLPVRLTDKQKETLKREALAIIARRLLP